MDVITEVCSALMNSSLENSVQFRALQLSKYPQKLDNLQDTAMNGKVFEKLGVSPEERCKN